MHKCAFLSILVLLWIAGCKAKPKFTEEELALMPPPKKEGLPEASGGFVLVVGGKTITSDEITAAVIERFRPAAQRSNFEQFKELTRPALEQILTNKISSILLYNQAKSEGGEGIDERLDKVVENEVKKFILNFEGDYARAEQALKEMGMDWQSFREYQKKAILSQSYIASQLPEDRPITYSELVDCYNEMKEESFIIPAMIKFRLIDIEAAKIEVADPNENRQEKTRELADKLVRQIRQGGDFGELAKQYSHGHMRGFGGLWKPVQPASLAKPYDILAVEAERMEPGQIAGPVDAGEHIFIMRLEGKRPRSFEPLEEVQKQVEAKIVFERRIKTIDELESKFVEQASVGEKDEFIDFCLEKIYRMSNQ